MSTTVKTGDRVKVTIEGKVATEGMSGHSFCRKITDDSGTHHFVYLDGGSSAQVEVVKPAENFTVGKAYQSAIGYSYIRTAGGWRDEVDTYRDDFPQRPMTPLVPEVTITEDVLKTKLRLVFRAHGDYMDRLSMRDVPRLVGAVKNAGVKVGE